MTTLIEKIQAEIDRAAEKCVDRDSLEIRDADREARAFKYGARLLLPLLKKAIEQRDWWLSELNEQYGDDLQGVTERENSRLLKLIGREHE